MKLRDARLKDDELNQMMKSNRNHPGIMGLLSHIYSMTLYLSKLEKKLHREGLVVCYDCARKIK